MEGENMIGEQKKKPRELDFTSLDTLYHSRNLFQYLQLNIGYENAEIKTYQFRIEKEINISQTRTTL